MKHYTDDELIDYLHNEVTDTVDVRMHAHLAQCRDCGARCDVQASLGDMIRASALAEERDFPAAIRANVWAAIRASEPTALERVRAFLRPAFALPLAVAVAVLMYFGVPILRAELATGSPTVAAAYYFEEHAAQGLENPLADHVNTNAALALGPAPSGATAPLIGAADAATLDDIAATRE